MICFMLALSGKLPREFFCKEWLPAYMKGLGSDFHFWTISLVTALGGWDPQ